jgi:SAM-dependent methyltransferase
MDAREIKAHINGYYATLYARERAVALPIKTGRELAGELGYPLDALDEVVSEDYWHWFIPCGNPLPYISPHPGSRILNLGCGAALDSFALLSLYGPSVQIVSMDIVPDILQRARSKAFGLNEQGNRLHWACGDGESLPFGNGLFDWVLMNGVFNLFPDKPSVLKEVMRVLKPGAGLVCADLCLVDQLPSYFDDEPDAWAWCMSGAVTAKDLLCMLDAAGFGSIRLLEEEPGDLFRRIVFSCRREVQDERGGASPPIPLELPQPS